MTPSSPVVRALAVIAFVGTLVCSSCTQSKTQRTAPADAAPVEQPTAAGPSDESRAIRAQIARDIAAIENALRAFARNNSGRYPEDVLVIVTPDVRGARYLDATSIPNDPWGRPYAYKPPDALEERPRIFTLGKDNQVGGEGDNLDVDNWMLRDGNEPASAIVVVAQSTAETAPDARVALARLADAEKRMKSFVAVYRSKKPDSEATVRFVYEAPGRGRMDLDSGDRHVRQWVIGDTLSVRVTSTDDSGYADLPFKELFAPLAEVSRALTIEFPEFQFGAGLGCGPGFTIETITSASPKEECRFDYGQRWMWWRDHVLGWLQDAERSDGLRLDEESIHYEPRTDEHVVLSRTTGFIQSIRGPHECVSLTLEKLELDIPVEAAEFVVPPPAENMRDATAELLPVAKRGLNNLMRTMIHRVALNALGQQSRGDAILQRKLVRVFTAFHAPRMLDQEAAYIGGASARIDEFLAWYGREFDQSRHSVDDRRKLDATVREWRSGMEDSFKQAIASLSGGSQPPFEIVATPEQKVWMQNVEVDGAREAFKNAIVSPLLKTFDDGVKSKNEGR